jgi:hypothetical protein
VDYSSPYGQIYLKARQFVKKLLVMLPLKRPLFLGFRALGAHQPAPDGSTLPLRVCLDMMSAANPLARIAAGLNE